MSQAERYPDVPGFQRFSDTSRAAAAQVSDVETIRQQVYDLIAGRAEGMTADAVAEHFGCYHNRTSPRIRELVLKGLLMDSGERRDTRSGRRAVVWIRAVLPLPVIEDPLVAGQLRLLPHRDGGGRRAVNAWWFGVVAVVFAVGIVLVLVLKRR